MGSKPNTGERLDGRAVKFRARSNARLKPHNPGFEQPVTLTIKQGTAYTPVRRTGTADIPRRRTGIAWPGSNGVAESRTAVPGHPTDSRGQRTNRLMFWIGLITRTCMEIDAWPVQNRVPGTAEPYGKFSCRVPGRRSPPAPAVGWDAGTRSS
jgi:hypothetical protein